MTDNYQFIYKQDKPFFINAIGGLILLFAVMRLLNSPVSGIVMIVASIGCFAYQTGIEINLADKKFRTISVFGPQTFGNWEDLPELDYISLFKTNIVFTTTGISGTSVSQKSSIMQVSLVTTDRKKIKYFEGKDTVEAIAKAKKFSKELNLDIWDATIRPADWYKE